MHSIRFTKLAFVGCTNAAWRRWRLRLVDFFVSKWLLNALYLRIFPLPVTLNVFFARECVFTFGILLKFGNAKVRKELLKIKKNIK